MEKESILLLIFSLLFLKPIAGANDDCFPATCGPHQPEIRFPFRLLGRQPARCGFPGFDLSCNKQNQTILRLPSSLSYIVNRISYVSQVIYIDPDFCRPNRILSVNVTNTPFRFSTLWSYTFYNCSSQSFNFMYPNVPFPCLSTGNYSVIAARTGFLFPGYMPSDCQVMKPPILVPFRSNSDLREEVELIWFTPFCRSCEMEGRACGSKSDGRQTVCVGSSRGISRNAKYGLSIGIGVPALICIIGLVCYASSRVQGYTDSNNQSVVLSSVTITPQSVPRMGLDGPTIESYPKTVLGESCRLPTDNSTCAICLSDYKPKESLRTIPECNHYFHSECIDEWLKLNATCPVCRNTPDSSALVTPCSSASSSSIDSS